MMMTDVARCGDGADFKRGHRDDRLVFQNSDAVFRDRCDSAPQSLHVVAEDPGSGRDQLGGINEVLSPAGGAENLPSNLGRPQGGPAVVKSNPTRAHTPDVVIERTNI